MSDSSTLTLGFAHYYHPLLSNAWVIILFVIFSLLAAIAYLVWAPKLYESRAVIAVEQEAPRVNNVQDFNGDNGPATNLPDVLYFSHYAGAYANAGAHRS